MSAPNISIKVEPLESGKVVFLPMAPGTANGKARGRIFLRLDITNLNTSAIRRRPIIVESVRVSFPNSSVSAETKNINVHISSGMMSRWWFQKPQDDIMFDLPGPSTIKLEFK